jgi:hypothetical protein
MFSLVLKVEDLLAQIVRLSAQYIIAVKAIYVMEQQHRH